jgi:hypothetical protein
MLPPRSGFSSLAPLLWVPQLHTLRGESSVAEWEACGRAAAGGTFVEMRFVRLEVLRTRLSWLVMGGVAVVLIAAAVDALRSSDSETPPAKGGLVQEREREQQATEEVPVTTLAETETAPLERCEVQQLGLRFERLGGTPVLALAHAWGSPCRTPRIPIEANVFARSGDAIEAIVVVQQAFAPTDLSPGVEVIAELQVIYLCGGRKPGLLVAEARPYVVRGWLPRDYGTCLDDLGP